MWINCLSLQRLKKGLRFALQFDYVIQLLSAVSSTSMYNEAHDEINTGVEAIYGIFPYRQIGPFSNESTCVKHTYCGNLLKKTW